MCGHARVKNIKLFHFLGVVGWIHYLNQGKMKWAQH